MVPSIDPVESSAPRTIFEDRRRPAKAVLTIREKADKRAEIGRCIGRACKAMDWTLDELADRTHKDRAQVSRWIAGTERPQFDALMDAGDDFWFELVVRLAKLSAVVAIETAIRRTA